MVSEFWTPERRLQLAELWTAGHSSIEIGRRMGITKNAVVGKAHRLGLKGRPSPIRRKRRLISPDAYKPKPAPVPLAHRPCSWPIGNPGEAGFRFCDEPAIEGRSYCPEHNARAYQRTPPKRLTP